MAGEQLWTSDCPNGGFIKELLGGDGFSPLSGFASKPAEGLFELGSSKVPAMNGFPWADGQSLLWDTLAVP